MADSRFYALRQYVRKKWPLGSKISFFLGALALALLLAYLGKLDGLSDVTANAFFLLVFAAALWISEAIPPFAVSILIIGFSIYFLEDIHLQVVSQDWQKYLNTWSNPVIWILLGGFFLAMGAQITQFDKKFSRLILSKFGSNPSRLLLGCMLTTGVLSMFMSNTATTAMMIAVILPIVAKLDDQDPYKKALFLGLAVSATLGGMGTVIGSPPNAIALGIIQNAGLNFGFLSWMLFGVPLALLFIFFAWFLIRRFYPAQCQSIVIEEQLDDHEFPNRNTRRNRRLVVLTFTITIGLWMTTSLHQMPVAAISFLPIFIFSVGGVIYAEDFRRLPWDTLILVAGGLTLGLVIADTGLDDYIVTKIPIFSDVRIMLILLALLTTLLSNIMSNTAAASILIPVGVSLLPEQGLLVALVIGLSASTALFLPISTPPNAIAFSYGYLKQSDFRKVGLPIGIICPLIIIVLVTLIL